MGFNSGFKGLIKIHIISTPDNHKIQQLKRFFHGLDQECMHILLFSF